MLYFAYGSNMFSKRLRERVPSCQATGAFHLVGWRLAFNKRASKDGSGKCTIAPSGGRDETVHGVVFDIDASEMPILDKIEGLGVGYLSKELEVCRGDEGVSVFTYVGQDSYLDDSLVPYDWYRAFVVAGAREHKLPEEYVRRILEVPVSPDPDQGRAARNRRLLEG